MASQIGVSQQVHPLGYLIGGPLQAIVEAHALLSQSALQFFSEFGFEHARDEKTSEAEQQASFKLRMLEFSYVHPVPDPANPGAVIDTPTHVKVPILAMLSLPSLRISEATLDFNIRVVGFTEMKKTETASGVQKARLPFLIQGVYTAKTPAVEKPEQEPSTLAISIKITKEPVPEGANRILSLMQDAIISHPVKEQTSPRPPVNMPSKKGK